MSFSRGWSTPPGAGIGADDPAEPQQARAGDPSSEENARGLHRRASCAVPAARRGPEVEVEAEAAGSLRRRREVTPRARPGRIMKALGLALLPLGLATAACSGALANIAADALGGDGLAFAADDDPELVRDAVPFGLKTIESLLETSPENRPLLLAAASGFTQYAYAFVQQDAERLADASPAESRRLLARARRLYVRARDYGLRGLAALDDQFTATFARDRTAALTALDEDAVPLLYWTAAAWALAVSLAKDDMSALGELPAVEALMARALALDEAFAAGAIHEFYVTYDGGRSEAMGGSTARAREHLERALRLSDGQKVGPYVAWAEVVCVQQQDRPCFDEHLGKALAFAADSAPRFRLVNLIAQERARWLRARVADLFVEE